MHILNHVASTCSWVNSFWSPVSERKAEMFQNRHLYNPTDYATDIN